MTHSARVPVLTALFVGLLWLPGIAWGQHERPLAAPAARPTRVVSIDPWGLAHGRLTGEADFCAGYAEYPGDDLHFGCSLTGGFTLTAMRHDREPSSIASRYHVDGDAFFRLRVASLSGPWVGFRTGLTYTDRYGIWPAVGTETGISVLMFRRVYTGATVGVRKVFALDEDSDLRYNPSGRVSVGVAF